MGLTRLIQSHSQRHYLIHLTKVLLLYYPICNYAVLCVGHFIPDLDFNCTAEDGDFSDNCMHNFKPHEHPTKPSGSAFEDSMYWYRSGQSSLRRKIASERKIEKLAKNVVFFLGDGMSPSTVTAARIHKGQLEGKPFGEEAELKFERLPNVAIAKTFCMDSQVADSACSATAFLCGTLGNIATIGLTSNVLLGDCRGQMNKTNRVTSVLAWAQARGMSTGIVTTTRVTHATPAGTYASIADRDWENDKIIKDAGQNPDFCDDIGEQLIFGEVGRRVNVILGGGRRELTPTKVRDLKSKQPGLRTDGKNLIEAWLTQKNNSVTAKYVWNKQQLFSINASETEYLLGLFSYDHMDFVLDSKAGPSLAEMTRVAINILRKSPNGFFLFVEGGRIDHAHHSTKAQKALAETIAFDAAVSTGLEMTSEDDTMLVVTSDHSHVMTIAGYPERGNSILGVAGVSDVDNLAYTTLSYANGPGYRPPSNNGQRHSLTTDDLGNKDYMQTTGLPLISETHGGDDVIIYSRGPFSHLLSGVNHQSIIPHVIAYAACLDPPGKGHLKGPHCSGQTSVHRQQHS